MRNTPVSLLREVEQQMQSFVDAFPDAGTVIVQRAWLQHWLTLIATAREAIEAPTLTAKES